VHGPVHDPSRNRIDVSLMYHLIMIPQFQMHTFSSYFGNILMFCKPLELCKLNCGPPGIVWRGGLLLDRQLDYIEIPL
jgi:hypothetical protein